MAKATALVPGSIWTAIGPEEDSSSHWEIKLQSGKAAGSHSETHVLADLSCGTVKVESAPATRSAREAASLWMVDLHDGTAMGTTGEIIVSVAGIAPLILLWSGISTWLRRRSYGAPRVKPH